MTDLQGNDILADLPCHHCGYNLRGLQENGRCPECGESIVESIRRRRAGQLDQRTATILRWGADGLLLTLGWPMIELVIAAWFGTRAAYFALGVGGILWTASWWALTVPISSLRSHASLGWLRPAIRCTSGAFAGLLLVQWIGFERFGLLGATLLAWGATFWLTFRYLHQLSRELREWERAAIASFARWPVAIPPGVLAVAHWMSEYAGLNAVGQIAGVALTLSGLMFVVGWIVAVIALYDARQMFRAGGYAR